MNFFSQSSNLVGVGYGQGPEHIGAECRTGACIPVTLLPGTDDLIVAALSAVNHPSVSPRPSRPYSDWGRFIILVWSGGWMLLKT